VAADDAAESVERFLDGVEDPVATTHNCRTRSGASLGSDANPGLPRW
jgi:hypothetical protein